MKYGTTLTILFSVLIFFANPVIGQEIGTVHDNGNSIILTDTLWLEDWESGWNNWTAEPDSTVWEIGQPTSGPGGAYSGDSCAATVLAGNYPSDANSRLVSPPFDVPDAGDNPRLRFYHWFKFEAGDYGEVQILVDGGSWESISGHYGYHSAVWTVCEIDLSVYGGNTVRFGFRIISNSGYEVSGWYVDDIAVITGGYAFRNPEDFELGMGDWYADNGAWQVGEPTSGPGGAYSGDSCAATVLAGNYPSDANSRLVSPPFDVPDAGDNPRLRFYHWFKFEAGDYGEVQILVDGGSWESISEQFSSENPNWPDWDEYEVNLSVYGGNTVRLGFRIISNSGYEVSGWYVDSLRILPIFGDCVYIPGDCNNDGTPIALDDVVAMVGMYRGDVGHPYECDCPPNGANFAPTADPNGNCIADELSDVVLEIGAYRGDVQASGCEDCPGEGRLIPGSSNQPSVMPSLKSKVKISRGETAD